MAAAIRGGEVRSEDFTTACVQRMKEVNPDFSLRMMTDNPKQKFY